MVRAAAREPGEASAPRAPMERVETSGKSDHIRETAQRKSIPAIRVTGTRASTSSVRWSVDFDLFGNMEEERIAAELQKTVTQWKQEEEPVTVKKGPTQEEHQEGFETQLKTNESVTLQDTYEEKITSEQTIEGFKRNDSWSSILHKNWEYSDTDYQNKSHETHLRCPSYTEQQNLTRVSEFFLVGLSDDPELQPFLFVLFLSMYLVTVLGNLLIILAVTCDSHLHTPMYFFLSNLSLADIGFTSTTVPKMIVDIQTHSRVISYAGCLTQMSFFMLFGCLDSLLLAVMAYDRFVAICHPLHYLVIMNPRLCGLLVLISLSLSLLVSQMHNSVVLKLTYFKDVEISHFFCDPSQLLSLACSDPFTNNIVMYFVGAISGFLPIAGILFSYYKIVSSVLRLPSSGGRYRAFSTCGSHLAVVCLFYGTGLGVYLSSAVLLSPRKDAVASVVYTVVTPMLNPFIYSLRNSDIKRAMRRFLSKAI
ncbi:olfactory receptor 18 [Camelus ferus]|nr:olfactory receptor 18 [Camelus ferus]